MIARNVKRICRSGFFVLLVLAAGRTNAASGEDIEQRYAALVENKAGQSDAVRAHELFKIRWEYSMYESPEMATYYGYHEPNDRWTDYSPAAIERRKQEPSSALKVIQTIHREKLTAADQLNYDLFKKDLERGIEGNR